MQYRISMTDQAYINSRVAEVENQIRELQDYRRFLIALGKLGNFPQDPSGSSRITAKNEGKFATLKMVMGLLSHGTPRRTEVLLRVIRKGAGDKRNERTLRSHLRRLREEGYLNYDQETRCWSLPE